VNPAPPTPEQEAQRQGQRQIGAEQRAKAMQAGLEQLRRLHGRDDSLSGDDPMPTNTNNDDKLLAKAKKLVEQGKADPQALARDLAEFRGRGESDADFLVRVRAVLERLSTAGDITDDRRQQVVEEYLNGGNKVRTPGPAVEMAFSMTNTPGQIMPALTAERRRQVVDEFLGKRAAAPSIALATESMDEQRRQQVLAEATATLPTETGTDWRGQYPKDQTRPAMEMWDSGDARNAQLRAQAQRDFETTLPSEATEADLGTYRGLMDRLSRARLELPCESWKTAAALDRAVLDLGKHIDSRRKLPQKCLDEFNGLLVAGGRR
jgi:hypothetical protein